MSEAGSNPNAKTGAAYRVLARKYRPADFSSLIGQEPMVRTLTNAFSSGRIAQAWILTGVRGVGKTTTARILARALNYSTTGVDQPSVELSTPGEHCQAIMEGRHVDVIEMDAASHTGIDDIRDIIERVRYAPVSARYKVYIIDEVHMLSQQAFNGLLKTLEEPPPHVKFIFATTEIRKVPITILSRCQRFDLRRVDASLLTEHLRRIATSENVEVEDEALAMIARAADGSVRDSLSIFDQAIAHGGETVTAQAVRMMLGIGDRNRVIDLFEHLMKGDTASALNEFRAQYDTGADPATVLTDVAEFNHLVTRLKFIPATASDASLTEGERQRGLAFSQSLSVRVLSRAWQMLLKGIPEVQGSNRPVSAGEMVLIRIAHAATLPTLDEALKKLDEVSLEPSGNGGARSPTGAMQPGSVTNAVSGTPISTIPQGSGGGQTMRLVQNGPQAVPARLSEPDISVVVNSLDDIAELAERHRDMALKILVRRCVRLVKIEPGRLDINLTDDAPKTLPGELAMKMKAWTGRNWLVSLSREQGGKTISEMEASKRESAILDARNDATVAAILTAFPGARIIDVRIPDAIADEEVLGDLPSGVTSDDNDDDLL